MRKLLIIAFILASLMPMGCGMFDDDEIDSDDTARITAYQAC